MLHANESSRRSRFKCMDGFNPTRDFQPRQTMTYGKRNKPLLLRGIHFMRSDPYDLLPATRQYKTAVPQRRRRAHQPLNPNDSPLSEGELEAVYGTNGISSPNVSPVLDSPSSRARFGEASKSQPPQNRPLLDKNASGTAIERVIGIPESRGLKALQVDPNTYLPLKTMETGAVRPRAGKVTFATAQSKPIEEATPQPVVILPRRQVFQIDSTLSRVSRHRIATPARRLPVDELLMVATPPDQPDFLRDPDISFAVIQTQDPIAHSPSPAKERKWTQVNDKLSPKVAPLASIRKRLKTPNFNNQSFATMRKKQGDPKPKPAKADRDIGDGFDAWELKIRPCPVKKRRGNGTRSLRGLGALQLQCGPLPEVTFEVDSGELNAGPSCGEASADEHGEAAQDNALAGNEKARSTGRKITFSDSFFDETTRAQLSTVSAPKRVLEISSDESEQEGEDEGEDDNSDTERTELLDVEKTHDQPDGYEKGNSHLDVSTARAATPTSFQTVRLLPSLEAKDDSAPTPLMLASARKTGVTFDFRESATPGFAEKRSRKPTLMELDEMIIDDPLAEGINSTVPQVKDRELEYAPGHRRRQGDLSAVHVNRPRSILRSNMPMSHGGAGTRPEDTLANTRRNSDIAAESAYFHGPPTVSRRNFQENKDMLSAVAIAKMSEGRPDSVLGVAAYKTATRRRRTPVTVEDDATSYFEMAVNQPHRSRPEVKPQRHQISHRPDAAASHIFALRREEAEVHALDSSAAVPKTSPQVKAGYMTNLSIGFNVVRRKEDTTWTSSQNLPTAKPAKSLKSLTRTVSRDFGTLSQAGKRRPTLPFQSPVKALAWVGGGS